MLRRFWLVFAQVCTVSLGVLFVVTTLRPDLLPRAQRTASGPVVLTQESGSPSAQLAGAPGEPRAASGYGEAARRAMPAVVNIYTSKEVRSTAHPFMNDPLFRRFFGEAQGGRPQRAFSLGSGVIVSAQGYVLTNNHVIEGADEIELVTSDGRRLAAKVVGADPDTDLAVLKVDAQNLPAITLGSDQGLQVGDVVLAIGNPFGVSNSVTMGIVSALGRNQLGINRFENFIQTDAAINPGNSGGALVDASGNLVGINTAIFSRTGGTQGIGFAVPVSIAKPVLEALIRDGAVVRGWIGVEIQSLTPDIALALGLPPDTGGSVIAGLVRGGPAEQAGLMPGDVVTGIADQPVRDTPQLLNQIAGVAPGTSVPVQVVREKRELTVAVQVGRRPKLPPLQSE